MKLMAHKVNAAIVTMGTDARFHTTCVNQHIQSTTHPQERVWRETLGVKDKDDSVTYSDSWPKQLAH